MARIISYDKENDILVAHKGFSEGERFKGNIDIGDLVLDMSTKMRVRGIEISNASKAAIPTAIARSPSVRTRFRP